MTEPRENHSGYAGQPGLFSPDTKVQPIVDHLAQAKTLERMRLGVIKVGNRQRFATLGDAERSLHDWWEGLEAEVLSTATPEHLADLDKIEELVDRSEDPRDLLTALVLTLPRSGSSEVERRLDLSERIADKIAEVAPNSHSHFAQHKAQRAREKAMGMNVEQTTQEGLREAIRQGREMLGIKPKPRNAA